MIARYVVLWWYCWLNVNNHKSVIRKLWTFSTAPLAHSPLYLRATKGAFPKAHTGDISFGGIVSCYVFCRQTKPGENWNGDNPLSPLCCFSSGSARAFPNAPNFRPITGLACVCAHQKYHQSSPSSATLCTRLAGYSSEPPFTPSKFTVDFERVCNSLKMLALSAAWDHLVLMPGLIRDPSKMPSSVHCQHQITLLVGWLVGWCTFADS